MICNTLSYLGYSTNSKVEYSFKDQANINAYAKASLNFLYENGIMTKDTLGNINPKNKITYEQGLAIISNLGYKYGVFNRLPQYSNQGINIDLFSKQSLSTLLNGYSFENESEKYNYYKSPTEIKNENVYVVDKFSTPINFSKMADEVRIFNVALISSSDQVSLEIDQNYCSMGGKSENMLNPQIYQMDIFLINKMIIYIVIDKNSILLK